MVDTIPDVIAKVNPKMEEPLSEHNFIYDSSSETLEPIYFFIIDLMNNLKFETEKLIDNFTSSPGSGHFSELGQRATIMQQQGSKILGDVNTVLRSVLNIIYDLKEFRIRLSHYDAIKGSKKEAGILALKQIWMDKVDINKGNSSIKAMAMGQTGFQTLIDAFLFVNTLEDVEKVDLNDRVKRILRARVLEFNDWLEHSEKELRKRYELEKNYLRSQVNSLKLYSRWAKPYLKAAQQLEMKEGGREPALVKAFNTILLELSILGKKKIKIDEKIESGEAPKELSKMKVRDYYLCVLVEFNFRGIPQRVAQQAHYTFGGRAEVSFKAYALNEEELDKLDEELGASDVEDVLRLIEGSTGESLEQLQEEINFFLEDQEDVEEIKRKKTSPSEDESNPFKAIIGGYDKKNSEEKKNKKNQKKEEKEKITVRKENYAEREILRKIAEKDAKALAFKLFDVYKKAHGMPSYT